MKKTAILFFALGLSFFSLTAQDKIKGNRNVTLKQTYIDAFKSLIIDADFSVDIVFNNKPSVTIETDDNLHDIINFTVVDSVLTLSESLRITSKKKLNITINYSNNLEIIEVRGNGEIRSLTSMELNNIDLTTSGNARAYLNIKAKNFSYTSSGKSKSRLNLTADSTKITLSDTSKFDALINSNIAHFDLYQRSDAVIEGTSNNATIRLDNSTSFNSPKFNVKQLNTTLEANSDLTITTTEMIKIEASGDSELYLYGEPEVKVVSFKDRAKIQKKNL